VYWFRLLDEYVVRPHDRMLSRRQSSSSLPRDKSPTAHLVSKKSGSV
jgi:hypothetical protein